MCLILDSPLSTKSGEPHFHLGEHGNWSKRSLFEESAAVPLIIARPDNRRTGQASPRIVELVDLYPTVTELCGVPSPAGLGGKSLRPLLDDPGRAWNTAAYTQYQDRDVRGQGVVGGRSVRTERWRYTEWDEGRAGTELYDHHDDPGEIINLSTDPTRARTTHEMKHLLREQRSGG